MINLQSKFGKRLMKVGDWLASLVSVNLVWFFISMPALIMTVLLFTLPNGGLFISTILIDLIMMVAFLVPATTALFRSVTEWLSSYGGMRFKSTFGNYLKSLTAWKPNLVIASVMMLWIVAFRELQVNLIIRTMLLVFGVLLFAVWLIFNYSQSVHSNVLTLIIQHPFKTLFAGIFGILFLGINTALKLAFFLPLCSMSLTAWVTIKLISGHLLSINSLKKTEKN